MFSLYVVYYFQTKVLLNYYLLILFKSIPNLMIPQGPADKYYSPISRPGFDTTGCATFDQAFALADELEQTLV